MKYPKSFKQQIYVETRIRKALKEDDFWASMEKQGITDKELVLGVMKLMEDDATG